MTSEKGDPMAHDKMFIDKCDGVYLVGNRRECVIVDVDEQSTSDIMNTQSVLAHLIVDDLWETVTDREQLPELVRAAIDRFSHSAR
jgi:hypothetical protein